MKLPFPLAPLVLALASQALAEGPAPATPEAWADRMTDPTVNASAFKDPEGFVPWAHAMTNPAMLPALGQAMLDPGTYARMAYGFLTPSAFENYMQFADPGIALRWLGAGMNPGFYPGLAAPLLNPATYAGWLVLPADTRMWNLGLQFFNPAVYTQWVSTSMDPKMIELMTAPLTPGMYGSWLGTVTDPETYPVLQHGQTPAAADAGPAAPPAK